NMNYASLNWESECSCQINSRNQIMMAMQNVVRSATEFTAQRGDELGLFFDRNRRMEHRRSQFHDLIVKFALFRKCAVNGPIKGYSVLDRKTQHAHQPILHSAAVKVFHYMDNFQLIELTLGRFLALRADLTILPRHVRCVRDRSQPYWVSNAR